MKSAQMKYNEAVARATKHGHTSIMPAVTRAVERSPSNPLLAAKIILGIKKIDDAFDTQIQECIKKALAATTAKKPKKTEAAAT